MREGASLAEQCSLARTASVLDTRVATPQWAVHDVLATVDGWSSIVYGLQKNSTSVYDERIRRHLLRTIMDSPWNSIIVSSRL